MMRRQYRPPVFIGLLALSLILLSAIGCGGGGGSKHSEQEAPAPNRLLQAIETTVRARLL